jgi:hypothetical protein
VLADYALRVRRAGVARAAAANHAARGRGTATRWRRRRSGLAALPPGADTDPAGQPVLSQSDQSCPTGWTGTGRPIRLKVIFGRDASCRSAQRQLVPWLQQLSDTLDRPRWSWRASSGERRPPYVSRRQPRSLHGAGLASTDSDSPQTASGQAASTSAASSAAARRASGAGSAATTPGPGWPCGW